jgi:hypothetical protein
VLGIVSGAHFLGSSMIHPTLLDQRERLPRTRLLVESVRVAYVDWRRKRMSGIRGLAQKAYISCVSSFPCMVYIDSNCRDFQI